MTLATGAPQPWDPYPFSRHEVDHSLPKSDDTTDDLVTWNERKFRMCEFAINDMEIRATDCTGADLDHQLARSGVGVSLSCWTSGRFADSRTIACIDFSPRRSDQLPMASIPRRNTTHSLPIEGNLTPNWRTSPR